MITDGPSEQIMSSTVDISKPLARMIGLPAELEPYREMLLANVIMVGEIPAPTFGERERVAFLKQRFTECGLQYSSSDEIGNGMGVIPGTEGKQTIMLSAHVDTPFDESINHTFTIEQGIIKGPGVADNSLGVAVLATLPTILDGLNIRLKNDLLLLAAARSLEQGNQHGLRFFLSNTTRPVTTGIVLEGCPLGRLNYRSMASMGGHIFCDVDRKVSQLSAIEVLNALISQLGHIDLGDDEYTALVLGSVRGGVTYKLPARKAELKFQLRSDTDQKVTEMNHSIQSIIDKEVSREGVSAHLEVIARTRSGGLDSLDPLVMTAREIMRTIGIKPKESIYSSIISPYLEHNIPAVCLGLSDGDNLNYPDEFIEIEPLLLGVAQVIGMLLCIDGGDCA